MLHVHESEHRHERPAWRQTEDSTMISIYDIGTWLIAGIGILMLATATWGAWEFRKRMRELGAILAKQSEQSYPDTGESGEAYNHEQEAKDPR